MKILVVDDEELLVKGIRFNLQNDGYQVVTGSNGREAIEPHHPGIFGRSHYHAHCPHRGHGQAAWL